MSGFSVGLDRVEEDIYVWKGRQEWICPFREGFHLLM